MALGNSLSILWRGQVDIKQVHVDSKEEKKQSVLGKRVLIRSQQLPSLLGDLFSGVTAEDGQR